MGGPAGPGGMAPPPRAVLDACVLYPTVMREVLLAAAAQGLFTPLWSARLLEEWARVAARHGTADETLARGEIALLRAGWPGAEIAADAALERQLDLPDRADLHVLASAISGGADLIVTQNLKDFPRRALARHGLKAQHPDAFLAGFLAGHGAALSRAAEAVRQRAEALSGQSWPMRKLLRKARLPRLGAGLARQAAGQGDAG